MLDPVNNNVPPVDAEYQFIVCPVTVDELKVTYPVPQELAPVVVGAFGIALLILKVLVILLPLHPVMIKVIVPVVKVVAYFILTEFPFLMGLIPIVVVFDTDQL